MFSDIKMKNASPQIFNTRPGFDRVKPKVLLHWSIPSPNTPNWSFGILGGLTLGLFHKMLSIISNSSSASLLMVFTIHVTILGPVIMMQVVRRRDHYRAGRWSSLTTQGGGESRVECDKQRPSVSYKQ